MYQAEGNAGLEQTVNEAYPSVSVKPANVMVVPNDKLVFSLSDEGGRAPSAESANAKAHLVIHNPTDQSIIYKFKTNAGKANVGVRPCVGHIHAGEKADVEVSLGFAEKADVDDLKILVVTAPAPQFDYDLKSVWKSVEGAQQNITKVKCVVNTDPMPSSAHGCYIKGSGSENMQVYGNPPPSSIMQQQQQQQQQQQSQMHMSGAPAAVGGPSMAAQQQVSMAPPPVAPKPKSLAAVLEASTYQEPSCQPPQMQGMQMPSCQPSMQAFQMDPNCIPEVNANACLPARPQSYRVSEQQPSVRNMYPSPSQRQRAAPSVMDQMVAETPTTSPRVPQPLLQYEQQSYEYGGAGGEGMDAGGGGGYMQGDMGQGKKPTSYFVDVSPIAEREMRASTPEGGGGYLGMDKNNIFQVFLMAAAGIAATKLFLD